VDRTALARIPAPSDDGHRVASIERASIMIASSVDILIDEHEDERTTHAEARLHTNDKTHLVGRGTARRNPNDTDIAEIGDELAVAGTVQPGSRAPGH
jgi:hypothetical protein